MNKLNVGDYVRTRDGCIGKIIKIENNEMINIWEEVPKKVEYENVTYEFIEENRHYLAYINRKEIDNSRYLMYMVDNLNDTVEILEEENKIEKLETCKIIKAKDILELEMSVNKRFADYTYKINQLIDEINKLKEDK